MIRMCGWCQKYIGKKPPYEDQSITHSICKSCEKKMMAELAPRGKNPPGRRKKPMSVTELKKKIDELTRTNAPGVIQEALANVYKRYANISQTEAEHEFWFKCARASQNLASGMNKWAGDMLDELEEGEESETEGG